MPARQPARSALLERTYAALDLLGEDLIEVAAEPSGKVEADVWREVGDWLLLGARVGAERIFFVNNDPVLVFSSIPSGADESEIISAYRRVWSMARPRCLFLAIGEELRVYGLDSPPPRSDVEGERLEPLEIVERAADVGKALERFHRDSLESGATFEVLPSSAAGRADQRLLRDVQMATRALIGTGLDQRRSHSLIERAVLIRYLEDRGVLTESYFDEVVSEAGGADVLEVEEGGLNLGAPSRFVSLLSDRRLTFALFDRLARDFNGDLFVAEPGERGAIKKVHLHLLRDMLLGVSGSPDEHLFLWAYDFSVVPTSLVSTMYELFYNAEGSEGASNAHYTPPGLVELVLADLLRPDVLERAPRICDPACGSGIFLVEAYRRIVRHEATTTSGPPSSERLRELLLTRIVGCDIDESAVRLAAFSLYVAFLNYQSPNDIREAGPLPPLISKGGEAEAPLIVADAFPASGEEDEDPTTPSPWGETERFAVVVGNPPWSEPKRKAPTRAERWAKEKGLAVGDRSPSQLFLWRALDLLDSGGVAALLVSAKVLFNVRTSTCRFRSEWLDQASLERVVNFSEVRHDYFEQGTAPFALLRFGHRAGDEANIVYETARRVAAGRRGSAALGRFERRVVPQRLLHEHDRLWKTFSAGSHRDAALIARLGLEDRLGDLSPAAPKSQYGYQRAKPGQPGAHPPDPSWRDLPSLKRFDSWGTFADSDFDPSVPAWVKFDPDPDLFRERSLLVMRGIGRKGPQARLVEEPVAFRHTIYGIPLAHRPRWQAQVALGTILSSLGRYWLAMVSGSWGSWYDEVRAREILELPLRLDRGNPATEKIVRAVAQLPGATPRGRERTESVFAAPDLAPVMEQIDSAVAELFELSPAEQDLVADFWASLEPAASKPIGTIPADADPLRSYLAVFDSAWSPQLGDRAKLAPRFWTDRGARVIAAVFELVDPGARPSVQADDERRWTAVLDDFRPTLRREADADQLVSYGMMRAVSDRAVLVVKRNERRLWTQTAAREDAEATIAQALVLQRR
jgi:hypothetical protein